MSGFAADWLALRQPADARGLDRGLLARLRALLGPAERLTVLDLGAGSGGNMALLAPHLPGTQTWRLVDADADLLARAEPPPGAHAEAVVADLAAGIDGLLAPRPDLVTAKALLDLAGRAWLAALTEALARHNLPLLATLSYDGRERWHPAHPADAAVLGAFHADQRRDKGLGPALGPAAHGEMARMLRDAGFEVTESESDWHLAQPHDAQLIAALAEGSAAATRDILGTDADVWLDARKGAQSVLIGHRDLLALPPR